MLGMFFLFFPPYCLSLDSGLNPDVGLPRAGLLIDILLHYCSLNVSLTFTFMERLMAAYEIRGEKCQRCLSFF